MRLDWASPDTAKMGNGYGYQVAKEHMRGGLRSHGWDIDADARLSVQFCPPDKFKRKQGKTNVLYTMCENTLMPLSFRRGLQSADVIVTPSQFCKAVFRLHTNKPVHVSPLGVDTKLFSFHQRRHSVPFRWLWVGAPNARKGWDVLADVWNRVFARLPGAQLYMKTTGTGRDTLDTFDNVVVDSRTLTDQELVGLYHGAHGFVLPTAGEGWALTCSEAMSTGLPTVVTNYSGVKDFTDPDTAYLIDYDLVDTEGSHGLAETAFARIVDLARAMRDVMTRYTEALRVGKRASKRMQQFSWSRSTKRFSDLLEHL